MKKKNEMSFHLNADFVLWLCAIFFSIMTLAFWFINVIKFSQQTLGAVPSSINGIMMALGGTCTKTVMGAGLPTVEIPIRSVPLITVTFFLELTAFAALIVNPILKHFAGRNLIWKILAIYVPIAFLIAGIISFFLCDLFWNSTQEEDLLNLKDLMVTDYTAAPFYGILSLTSALISSLQLIYLKKNNKVNQLSL